MAFTIQRRKGKFRNGHDNQAATKFVQRTWTFKGTDINEIREAIKKLNTGPLEGLVGDALATRAFKDPDDFGVLRDLAE